MTIKEFLDETGYELLEEGAFQEFFDSMGKKEMEDSDGN